VCAVKKVSENAMSLKQIEDFKSEANVMVKVRPHPGIVRLLGICSSPLCIVMEYVPNGSLLKWLRRYAKISVYI
jgi:serine/threonine protein kinase